MLVSLIAASNAIWYWSWKQCQSSYRRAALCSAVNGYSIIGLLESCRDSTIDEEDVTMQIAALAYNMHRNGMWDEKSGLVILELMSRFPGIVEHLDEPQRSYMHDMAARWRGRSINYLEGW